MRHKVGNTGDEIEIGRYREVNKGSLKAFFTLIIYSAGTHTKADKTIDCRYFVSEKGRWFKFPEREVKRSGDVKPLYVPIRTFEDTEYVQALKEAVITALKNPPMEPQYAKSSSAATNARQVFGNTPDLWEDAPF